MMMMRVLVCGGRDYCDPKSMHRILKQVHESSRGPITCIIHGGARGADHMSGLWARKHKIEEKVYPADWGKHGSAAGLIRNAQMLAEGFPDICVAFPGGRGTEDMVTKASKRIPTYNVLFKPILRKVN